LHLARGADGRRIHPARSPSVRGCTHGAAGREALRVPAVLIILRHSDSAPRLRRDVPDLTSRAKTAVL